VLFGVPGALMVGKPFASFVEAHARSEFRAHLVGLLTADRLDKWMIETKVRDERMIAVEATVATLETRAEGKKTLCWLLHDVSARRASEESMQALNRSLNARVAQRTRE